jgi:hypothetical protein
MRYASEFLERTKQIAKDVSLTLLLDRVQPIFIVLPFAY